MRPAIFTIASDLPFLDALVAGLRAQSGEDPLALARHTILLPTRRAARALSEAFLRASAGHALLLPRLVPVGDVDTEELAFLAGEGDGLDGFDTPPPVPELQRQLALTRLVLAFGKARGGGPVTAGQAAPLARELARFLDEVETAGSDFAGLAQLVPAEHARHWQEVLAFLAIVTEHWPRYLAELGCLDPAERRNRVLAAQAQAWRRQPPRHPVIAAGLTGGVAAVAELVAVVAALPQGSVVLPGLDREADDASWQAIAADPAHPQHLLARLLARLEVAPAAVREWPYRPPQPSPARGEGEVGREARRRLVVEAMRPAAESHRWRSLAGVDASALDGMMRLDCAGPQEEAAVIALLLRQALEESGKTAALITSDRGLARRVAAELGRWQIEIDDSAGVPLNKTPPGVFLRLLLDLADQDLAPVPLLAALKHPLAAGGRAPDEFRARLRQLEIAALRGPRPAPGFAGLAAALGDDPALQAFIGRLSAALAPLLAALAAPAVPLGDLAAAHVAAAEALAASDGESGPERLWREPAGEAGAEFFAELLRAASSVEPLAGRDYPALFEALIAGPVVRPRFGRHPRLAIWGLLEARLQQADLVILGGLNEGVWPPEVDSDPWLSRPMRTKFGLPPPERRIGAAAHDFVQALGARSVVLTRASRVEGAPTVPSRWLSRLDTVLRAAGLDGKLAAKPEPLAWQALLDRPDAWRATLPPEPRPPVAVRPRRLSVTQVETWMRDPYALYAREVLGLRALDPIDADPGAAERGRFIHDALDKFVRAFPGALPDDAERALLAHGIAAFGDALARPGVRAFWWPRFERIARWFLAEERVRRRDLVQSHSEIAGRLAFAGPHGGFALVAKVDRLDRRRAGGLVLIDYKTGGVPLPKEVLQGFAPQLPLEAAIAEAGGFPGVAAAPVAELVYWRLSGGDPPGEAKAVAQDAAAARPLIDDALHGLRRLIALFDDPATPYRSRPRPDKAPRYSDYEHLARVKEWSVSGEEEE
jgi:ATP-dependent helicase/nuclease subunit B